MLGRSLHFLEEHDTLEEHYQNPTVNLYALAPSQSSTLLRRHRWFRRVARREAAVADTVGDKLGVIADGLGNVKDLRLRLSSL